MWRDVNRKSLAIGVALGLASTIAIAQQQPEHRGFYGGLSLGQSRINFSDSVLDFAIPGTLSKEDTSIAWKLFAGYRIHRNIAVEGGYTDFGKFKTTRTFTTTRLFSIGGSSASASTKISGFHLEGVGIIPIRKFSIFLKAGTLYSTTETSVTTTGPLAVVGNPDRKKSEFNLKLGFGGAYDITRNWAVRVEYEQVRKVGDETTGEGDVRMLSVGGVYKF